MLIAGSWLAGSCNYCGVFVSPFKQRKTSNLSRRIMLCRHGSTLFVFGCVTIKGGNCTRTFTQVGLQQNGTCIGTQRDQTEAVNGMEKTNNKMKLRIMQTCIFPTATHGCETWTLNKNITQCINAFENKCYRKTLRVSWTEPRTNQPIADELGVTSGMLLNFIRMQKLTNFGHI